MAMREKTGMCGDLDPGMITSLVEQELAGVRDPDLLEGMKACLVTPSCEEIPWDYGEKDQTYPCWTFMRKTVLDCPWTIQYCAHGFGPRAPWGLGHEGMVSMGMDCGWFPTLAEAFLDSRLQEGLPLWDVQREAEDGSRTVVARSLSHTEAFALSYRLDGLGPPEEAHERLMRSPYPDRRHRVELRPESGGDLVEPD